MELCHCLEVLCTVSALEELPDVPDHGIGDGADTADAQGGVGVSRGHGQHVPQRPEGAGVAAIARVRPSAGRPLVLGSCLPRPAALNLQFGLKRDAFSLQEYSVKKINILHKSFVTDGPL